MNTSKKILNSQSNPLLASEEEYRTIVENTREGILVMQGGERVYYNPRWLEITGYSAKEYETILFLSLIHPDDTDIVVAAYKKLIAGEKVKSAIEFRLVAQSGKVKHLDAKVSRIEWKEQSAGMILVDDITESKRAENALEKSQRQFKAIADHTPDHIVMHDHELRYTRVINPQLGLTEEDMLGKTDYDFLSKEEADKLVEAKKQVMETGKAIPFAISLISQSGSPEFFDGTFIPTFDKQNQSNGLIGYFKNTTESKEAEKALKNSEERFRELVNTINSGVAIYKVVNDGKFGSDYIIQEFNEYSLTHEQMEEKDVIGKTLKDIRPSIDEYGLIDTFRNVWKTGEAAFFSAKKYVDEKYSNFYENRIFRLPSGEIVAVYDDVSDRENAIAKIEESQERFDLAMQASRDGVFDWNLETNEIYYSPGWKSMLGYEYDEIPNDFSIWETNTHPEDVKRSWQMQQEVIDKKRDRFEMEFKMKHKDGHWVDILSRAEAVFNKNGKTVRMIGTHVDITERKEAEIALLDSEEKYKALYENAPLAYQSLDEDGSFRDINPTWLSTLGYTQEEVLGHFFVDFLHPDWQPRFKKYFPEFKRRGYVSNVEYKIRHKDGHYLDISFEGCIGYNPDGSFRQTYCVFKDITEQKKAEEGMAESEEKYRLLHENAGLGIGYYSVDGTVISFNAIAARDMNGVPEDFAGKSIFDLFSKESADFYFERLQKAINKDEISVYEDHVQLPSQEKWFLSTYTKIVNSEDETLGIQIISQNISEQKEAEGALQKSENRYRNLVETASDAIYLMDEDGFIIDANQSACNVLGKARGEIIGQSIDAVDPNYPVGEFLAFWKDIPFNEQVIFESTHLHKDGSFVPVELSAKKYKLDEKVYYYGIVRDITERKQAEISLRNSEEKHRRYVENAPVGVFVVDSAGKYIVINSVACELLGYTQSELLELSIPDVAIRKEAEDSFQRLKESGKLSYEGQLKKKDGSLAQVKLDAVSLPNDQFIAFCTDITERKLAEKELEKHRNHLEELVEQRTEELEAKMKEHDTLFNMMIGREIRMGELKKVIKSLRKQLWSNEIKPIANDPMLADDEEYGDII